MLKKLLTSFATLTLVAGAVTSSTAWIQQKNVHQKNISKKPKNIKKLNPNYSLHSNNFHHINSIPDSFEDSNIYGYNNVIYAIYGDDSFPFYGHLYESTDNGKTFAENTSIPTNSDVTLIYAYNNVVYVLADGGLWESTDNGKTFHQNTSIPTDAEVLSIYAYNKVVYCGTDESGLYESTDNGKTFVKNALAPLKLSIGVGYNNVIYAAYNGSIWESRDNGKTFVENSSIEIINRYHFIDDIYAYNNKIYVGTGSYSGHGFGNGLYESSDNGVSFQLNSSISSTSGTSEIRAYNNVVYLNVTDSFSKNSLVRITRQR